MVQVGSVIRNPEIKNLTPFLLEALSDPARKIAPALTKLNSTRFVHHIDAASLALIMPIVQRAFNERSPEVRKLSAQIVGGMCSRNQALCSGSDLMPYLAAIMPGLRITLTDPVPDVRATAAKGKIIQILNLGVYCILLWSIFFKCLSFAMKMRGQKSAKQINTNLRNFHFSINLSIFALKQGGLCYQNVSKICILRRNFFIGKDRRKKVDQKCILLNLSYTKN
jgi:hypothetical protein